MVASHSAAPLDDLRAGLMSVADVIEAGATGLIGSHLEGPFLAESHCGAQDIRHFAAPDRNVLSSLLRAGRGTVRMMTLAPELSGADELIADLRDAGVVAAFGHTDATYEEVMAAIVAGATVSTHLFNGMRKFHHRDPGAVGAALDHPGVICEVIGDLLHVHPAVVRSLFALKGDAGVALVTDATQMAGLADGAYQWGDRVVTVRGGTAVVDGSLAGSTATMIESVRNLVAAGIPLADVIRSASTTPAQAIGLAADIGEIEPGMRADLVVLDRDLGVVAVIVDGRVSHGPPSWIR